MNVSLLVGLKNNLEYTKYFYRTTRKLYPNIEICFVSYGSTDGTHGWLESLRDVNVKWYYSNENKTFSDTFNKAALLATNEYIAYLHNDIVLAPNFIENIIKHVNTNRVVSYTTIEPPIFSNHERPGKIIRDFGIDINSFSITNMYKCAEDITKTYADKTEPGITFFMCMHRKTFIDKIGGMDNLFNPMFCEDDDLILRFKLLGFELITSLDSICYHFVSKTSRFSDEYRNSTDKIEFNSNKNFIRKWGFRNSKHNKKYNIAFVVKNSNVQILEVLEPWCDRIYLDDEMQVITSHYIENEQPNTKFDLSKRILIATLNDPKSENDIVLEFDARHFTQNSYNIIQNLSDIITESGEVGEFELDIFKISIQNLESYEKDLIYVKI